MQLFINMSERIEESSCELKLIRDQNVPLYNVIYIYFTELTDTVGHSNRSSSG